MFRKPSKKKKISKIRKRDEEEEGEDEDQSVQDKIRSTQKKQKILSSLPLVTGNPSRKSKTKSNDVHSSENATGEMSVMEKKHHQLMQEYIEDQMNKNKPSGNDNTNAASAKSEDTKKPSGVTSEEELYQELVKEVYSKKQGENQQVQEERGAVLVGGTGLAEVILPPSLSGTKGNQQHQSKNRVYRRDASSSAVPASSSKATLTTSAVPQFRSFQHYKTRTKNTQPTAQEEKDSDAKKDAVENGDADRVGFNAYRGKPTEKKPMVKKQRDDSVFSDFVKHQREKMMNRR